MENKTKLKQGIRYGFAVIVIIIGLILNYANLGGSFLGFSSIGSWLIYIGFVMIAIVSLQVILNKKRVVDERMVFVADKANRIAFLALIIAAFVIMIIDGIRPITIPYHMFMAYLVCGILVVYVIAYKILLRYY